MCSCLRRASVWWVWGSKNRQPVVIKRQPRVPQPDTSGSHPTHSPKKEARGRSQELLWSLHSRHNSSQAESIIDRRGTAIFLASLLSSYREREGAASTKRIHERTQHCPTVLLSVPDHTQFPSPSFMLTRGTMTDG